MTHSTSALDGRAAGLLALGVLGLAACAAAAPARGADPGARVQRRLGAMGTSLGLEVWARDRDTALAASEAAVRAVERVEARLSTWRDDSELARLNRAPVGEPVRLDEELARDLGRARELWRATGGAFDPGIGALVELWGLRSGGVAEEPSAARIAAALEGGGLAALQLDGTTAVRTRAALRIEEGGFGKGIGLDEAVAAAARSGATRAVIDLGGQIAVLGSADQAFAVADPRDRMHPVLEVVVDHGSLATSAASERGITVAGRPFGHVLDPRTGRPAPDFGSVTVWATDAVTADALSTALFVLGPDRALAFAAEHPGVEAIVLERVRGEGWVARASAGLVGRVISLDAGFPVSTPPFRSR